MLLDLICHFRPHHHLIIGDFDELPDIQVPGKNAPLVASKVHRPSSVHAGPSPLSEPSVQLAVLINMVPYLIFKCVHCAHIHATMFIHVDV